MIPLVWPHFYGCGLGSAGGPVTLAGWSTTSQGERESCGLGGDCRSWATAGCGVVSTVCHS